jgi:hypothetical protein
MYHHVMTYEAPHTQKIDQKKGRKKEEEKLK